MKIYDSLLDEGGGKVRIVGWLKMSDFHHLLLRGRCSSFWTKNPRRSQHEFEKILGALGWSCKGTEVETGGRSVVLTVHVFLKRKIIRWRWRNDHKLFNMLLFFGIMFRSLRIRRRRWWWLRYMKLKIMAMMADIGFQSKLLGKCNRDLFWQQHWIWFYAVEHGPRSCTY